MASKQFRQSASFITRHPFGFGRDNSPRWVLAAGWRRIEEYRHLSRRLRELKASANRSESCAAIYDRLLGFPEFKTDQKRVEILALLARLQQNPPRHLCEIGTSFGGTLFLLAQVSAPDATIISIDLGLPWGRSRVHSRMQNSSQKIFSLGIDSQSAEALRTTKSILRDNKLDFLLIDGDHSYEGVQADFLNYSPLMRKGGLIALHDIVPDYSARLGIETGTWTGGVPNFWRAQQTISKTEEIIEDPDQDGYGLGLVYT